MRFVSSWLDRRSDHLPQAAMRMLPRVHRLVALCVAILAVLTSLATTMAALPTRSALLAAISSGTTTTATSSMTSGDATGSHTEWLGPAEKFRLR